MSNERNITTGISGIWRNRSYWLHLGRPTSPVVTEGTIANAANKSKVESEKRLFGTRLKIMIYEAHPDKYESLDQIKI